MKIVHAADLHIDSPLRGVGRIEDADVDLLRRATRLAFEHLITFCLEAKADLLLLAGDLFDGEWKDSNSGVFLMRQLRRLQDVGTQVVLIEGNHDAASKILRSLRWAEHVHLLPHRKPESLRFENLGIVVHGQSFARQAVTEDLAASYPPREERFFNIGLLHTNATGSTEHDPYAPCSVTQLVRHGYDYWALGHIHKGAVLHEDPWVVYPGNLQGRHVRETGEKGCRLVEVTDGRMTALTFVPLDVVRWEEVVVDIGKMENLDDFIAEVTGNFQRIEENAGERHTVVRVQARGTGPLHGTLIDKEVQIVEELRICAANFEGIWVEKFRRKTTPPKIAGSSLSHDLAVIIQESTERLLRNDPAWEHFAREMEKFRKYVGAHLPGISDSREAWTSWLAQTVAEVPDLLQRRLLSAAEEEEEPDAL